MAQHSQASSVRFCHADFSQRLHYQLSESLPELPSEPSPAHLLYTNAKYLDKLSPQILQAKMGATGRAGPTLLGVDDSRGWVKPFSVGPLLFPVGIIFCRLFAVVWICTDLNLIPAKPSGARL